MSDVQMKDWLQLAEGFSSQALTDPSRSGKSGALAQMCLFMSRTKHGQELAPITEECHIGSIVLGRRDGSFPSKRLHVQMLQDNEIEFCLRESASPVVDRYFSPREPYFGAVEKFKKIIESLDWSEPVKAPGRFEGAVATAKVLFNPRYWGGHK